MIPDKCSGITVRIVEVNNTNTIQSKVNPQKSQPKLWKESLHVLIRNQIDYWGRRH